MISNENGKTLFTDDKCSSPRGDILDGELQCSKKGGKS